MNTDNDDETMTEAEIDAEFERTQPIGNAINALAQAELIVGVADEIPAEHQERLGRVLANVLDEIERNSD